MEYINPEESYQTSGIQKGPIHKNEEPNPFSECGTRMGPDQKGNNRSCV
jgi:hypothetical protein